MEINTLTIKRRQILGDLYAKCDVIKNVPIYLDEKSGHPIGYVNDSPERYADALLFQLPGDVCKKLSTGSYNFDFDFGNEKTKKTAPWTLEHIILKIKLPQPIPRHLARVAKS